MTEDNILDYVEKKLWKLVRYLDDVEFQDIGKKNYGTKSLALKLIHKFCVQETLSHLKNLKHPLKNEITKLMIIFDKYFQDVIPKLHWTKNEKETQILRFNNVRRLLQQRYAKTLESYAAQLNLENQLRNSKNPIAGKKCKTSAGETTLAILLQNPDLTDTESNILEDLGNDILKGPELLKKAGYSNSSHYRGILSNLKKRRILGHNDKGYFALIADTCQ